MYSGYLLSCNSAELAQYISSSTFVHGNHNKKPATDEIKRGTVLFMYNVDSKALIGPFTAEAEGATKIETGAWSTGVNEHSASQNITVEWEDLHVIENANERFSFLKSIDSYRLSSLQVQTLLDALKEGAPYKGQELWAKQIA